MHLSPHEQERLLPSCAAELARRRGRIRPVGGTARVERAGRPVLHTTVRLGPGEPAWLPPVVPRAYASLVHLGSEDPDVDVRAGKDAVRLPLPDGWVTTVWGAGLRAAEALNPLKAVRVPA